MNKKEILLVVVLLISTAILFYYIGRFDNDFARRGNELVKPDTVFLDKVFYDSLNNEIDTVYKYIKDIENEKDNRLETIDTISNDSAVILFLHLVSD